ncbi:uncharacterized protein LOC101849714 [Aplysia californica]|uniref:Uncharacterized protein LOC101849714 n=1 Tax=Aplysia californica TaxID=6500 RepID=A0ABM0JY70_APLCA|nr:uncharacterized protein LOC101849714 [Aplysia californica]
MPQPCFFHNDARSYGMQENVYEKWLRRRLDYAVIRETGNHAAPGFIHTLLHSGDCPSAVTSELRKELWQQCKLPSSTYFSHGIVTYSYPDTVKEIMDLRFAQEKAQGKIYTPMSSNFEGAYNISFHELASAPNWMAPLTVTDCTRPHTLETPMTWPLDNDGPPGLMARCPDPRRVNEPVFPKCCHNKECPCSAIYCREPLPEAVYNPGPMVRGDALLKWR